MTDCSDDGNEHIYIQGVGTIPVREFSDDERRQRRLDAAVADALHTPEELQRGMYHERADVRWRVVPRLVARGAEHPDRITTLLDVLQHDPSPAVLATVALALHHFSKDNRVLPALEQCAGSDSDDDVRANARYSIGQVG